MIERIIKLLADDRIHRLMGADKYSDAVYKLNLYKNRIKEKKKLFPLEVKYIENIEKDIENIDRHIKKGWVNGEPQQDIIYNTKGA